MTDPVQPGCQTLSERELAEQAEVIAALLPKLMRQMFNVIDIDDPACELPLSQVRVCQYFAVRPTKHVRYQSQDGHLLECGDADCRSVGTRANGGTHE